MRAPLAALALLIALAPALPAGAIEICSENALGQVVCRGQPTHGLDPIDPFPPRTRTAPPPQARIPEARTNSFGDTYPTAKETTTGRPRPRVCEPDSFGNLRC
ncbi:hypothetical protein [Amaricoccus solimangrovi]|uniref:DUF4124 domain-containing protein n=1 Tax=Amaricoccus solimangrovi TaxID=2589815 RepID=A0A501WG07_9RHOB|nr:hypothetical protein [Amaricoccus solimangrovi]TPE48803.1 hypothetical protein FJM51_16450 [Amaricoccus solimangrovi]